jgi:hypothetical protein
MYEVVRKTYSNAQGNTQGKEIRRCITCKLMYIIEAKSVTQKTRKQLEFVSDSYEILIDNCCSHSLTNCKEDFIEPPVTSKVKVR